MTEKNDAKRTTVINEATESAGNVDRIRDILFGGQMKDYERRFGRLEEKLAKDTARTKDEILQRLDTFETYVRGELDQLSQSIAAESKSRAGAVDSIEASAKRQQAAVSQTIDDLDKRFGKDLRTLRQQQLDAQQKLEADLRTLREELNKYIDIEIAELRDAKVECQDLSALLSEVALRISGEFQLPGD